MKEPTKLFGSFSWVVNGGDVYTVAKAVNYNADVLEELISKVEDLEKQIADMRGKPDETNN